MKNLCFLLIVTVLPVCISAQDTKQGSQPLNPRPFILGQTVELTSVVLSEKRILNIYLPEDYKAEDSIRYPVIYLLDGAADEDFIHVVGLVQFNTFPWINRIPKSIVVGIANTDRKRDFTFPTSDEHEKKENPTAGQSGNFISFIEKELQPFIDKNFKTNRNRTIIGQSLGGLLATEILFTRPRLFDKYIIISPSLWWNKASLLGFDDAAILQEDFIRRTDIYIGVGKEGLTPGTEPRIMEVDANLLAEKIRHTKSKHVNVKFDYLPAEDHATISHQAISNAFRIIYLEK